MEQVFLNKILLLANIFEQRAMTIKNSRIWALQSLISLAENDLLQFFQDDLSKFIGVSLSKEDFHTWLNKNATTLSQAAHGEWTVGSDQHSNFLEAFAGEGPGEEYYFYRIYKAPIPAAAQDYLKIKESTLLQGNNKIPNLFFYKVIPLNQSPTLVSLDKKYSPYLYLAEMFQGSLGITLDKTFPEKFINFVERNKHKLNSIASFMRYHPKFLGRGSDGMTFDIAPQYVLKLFRDKKAFQDALTAMHTLHKSPALAKTEAMIYDAGSLGEFEGKEIFYYIIEKMQTVHSLPDLIQKRISELVRKIIYFVNNRKHEWRSLKEMEDFTQPIVQQKIKEGVARMQSTLQSIASKDIKYLEDNLSLRKDWLASLIEEIVMKYLTSRTDLHLGNLGLTGYGHFRYFDPGYTGIVSNIHAGMPSDLPETL